MYLPRAAQARRDAALVLHSVRLAGFGRWREGRKRRVTVEQRRSRDDEEAQRSAVNARSDAAILSATTHAEAATKGRSAKDL
jgi:hypothetical protein